MPATVAFFVAGVQWHPENLTGEEHLALFCSFREACLGRCPNPGPRTPVPGAS
jgi:gamma-glutamyl-gamma-aminobutyrate hydrolase PuuD